MGNVKKIEIWREGFANWQYLITFESTESVTISLERQQRRWTRAGAIRSAMNFVKRQRERYESYELIYNGSVE